MELPGVQPEERRCNLGRPTLWKPEYDAQARKLCELGATNKDLADFFGVSERTIEEWQVRIESFAVASRVGKEHADERVKASAFKVAIGYEYDEEFIDRNGNKQTRRVVVPPNPTMQMKWLAVRGKKEFAEKTQIEHSGSVKTDSIDLKSLTDDQLSKYMVFMESVTKQGNESDDV